MIKILHIHTALSRGGAASVAQTIHSFLNKNSEFESYFAYGRGRKMKNKKIFRFSVILEVFLHGFLVRFIGIEGWGTYFSTRKLIRYIEKNDFNLIHLHNLHGYYLNIWKLFEYLNKKDIPIIWTLHDEWALTWLPAYSMGCEHCKVLKGVCSGAYPYPKTYNRFFSRFLLKKKQKAILSLKNLSLVCPSYWLKEQTQSSFLKEKEVRVIYNGVDTAVFKKHNSLRQIDLKKRYNLPLNKKIVLFYADFKDKRKGTDYVIALAKSSQNNEEILFLGFGPSSIHDMKNIITVGFVKDKEELSNIYAIGDLFIFLSSAETFSLTTVESIMCGTPVLAFDLGPFPEILTNTYGTLIPEHTQGSLQESFEKTLTNLGAFKNIPDQKFVDKFRIEEMLKNYMNLYIEKLK